jgi:hypothetical protein
MKDNLTQTKTSKAMENTLINQDFERSIKRLRQILPKLAFGLLIGTYLISAIIMGFFHAKNAPELGFKIAAFCVPLVIQAGRGTLVFFFQLNPSKKRRKFSFGILAATLLLILSMVEAFLVMYPYGLSWTVSVLTLMIIGWLIEVMILEEISFATKLELSQSQSELERLVQCYGSLENVEAILRASKTSPPPNNEKEEPKEEGEKEPIFSDDSFYGIKIDRNNPMLTHNVLRLKNRFQERYDDSIKKAEARKKEGKAPHQAIERSIKENKERLNRADFILNTLLKQTA